MQQVIARIDKAVACCFLNEIEKELGAVKKLPIILLIFALIALVDYWFAIFNAHAAWLYPGNTRGISVSARCPCEAAVLRRQHMLADILLRNRKPCWSTSANTCPPAPVHGCLHLAPV